MATHYKLSGVYRDGDVDEPLWLGILTPAGRLRKIPLTLRELAGLVRNGAAVLEVEIKKRNSPEGGERKG